MIPVLMVCPLRPRMVTLKLYCIKGSSPERVIKDCELLVYGQGSLPAGAGAYWKRYPIALLTLLRERNTSPELLPNSTEKFSGHDSDLLTPSSLFSWKPELDNYFLFFSTSIRCVFRGSAFTCASCGIIFLFAVPIIPVAAFAKRAKSNVFFAQPVSMVLYWKVFPW